MDIAGGITVDFASWYYQFFIFLMMANSFINPFIYAVKYRDFQHGVRLLLQRLNLSRQ